MSALGGAGEAAEATVADPMQLITNYVLAIKVVFFPQKDKEGDKKALINFKNIPRDFITLILNIADRYNKTMSIESKDEDFFETLKGIIRSILPKFNPRRDKFSDIPAEKNLNILRVLIEEGYFKKVAQKLVNASTAKFGVVLPSILNLHDQLKSLTTADLDPSRKEAIAGEPVLTSESPLARVLNGIVDRLPSEIAEAKAEAGPRAAAAKAAAEKRKAADEAATKFSNSLTSHSRPFPSSGWGNNTLNAEQKKANNAARALDPEGFAAQEAAREAAEKKSLAIYAAGTRATEANREAELKEQYAKAGVTGFMNGNNGRRNKSRRNLRKNRKNKRTRRSS